ncbi:transcription factor-like protein [Wolffia australiana]
MSSRLVRRVLREQGLKPLDSGLEQEAEDYAESSVSSSPFRNPFDLLDDQEDEQDDGEEVSTSNETVQNIPSTSSSYNAPAAKRKTKKKKKKAKDKGHQKVTSEESIDPMIEKLSISTDSGEKEVDVSDEKLNEIQRDEGKPRISSVLTVDPKFLKAENELRKIFGSKVVSSLENNQNTFGFRGAHSGRRSMHNIRKSVLVSPQPFWPRWDGSLSMEVLESEKGEHFFRYVQNPSYKRAQEIFEAARSAHDINTIAMILARLPYHVEALLIFSELYKFSGEHHSSADAIAKCLYALECAWHPQFNALGGNCRLKYTHETNRPLFQALFQHMNSMHRRGCHRSALEVCKLLLSLDTDDPMGALFCIDYFALRAQEFKWLEQFAEEYHSDSSIWLFPNFSFSLAISRLYLETTEEVEKAPAIDLMKQALMLHPLVLKKLVAKVPLKDRAWTEIISDSFFKSAKGGSPSLEHLINIYVERSYIMWRLPELQSLLKKAAIQVIESLKRDSAEAKDWACVRKEAFPSEKNEYSHLLVSDFSDTIPTLPPEEVRHFMVGQHAVPEVVDENWDNGVMEEARQPRDVAGRNPLAVFLESLLPWADFGTQRNGHAHGPDQDQQEEQQHRE